jgi:hypothetical protein
MWGAPPVTPGDVHLQQNDRAQAQLDQHAGALRNQYPALSDQQLHETINRRPVLASDKDKFQRLYDARVKDELFMEKWRRGDGQARGELFLLNTGRAMPTGTLEQIAAWDAAFPFTPKP